MGLKGTHKSDGIHKKMVGGTPGELLEIWWKSKENGRGYPREAVGDLMEHTNLMEFKGKW